MNYWEYIDYASEITMLEDIIANIPDDKPARKLAFGNRLSKAKAKIEGIPMPERPLEVQVAFTGRPVLSSSTSEPGIEAGFSAQAMNEMALAIDLTAAGTLGTLHPTGGVPRKGIAPTYITGVSTGSFGFKLQIHPDEREGLFADDSMSQTRTAVSLIQDLLDAAAAGDDNQLGEAIGKMNQRAVNKVADFMGLLKRSDARLAVAFQDREVLLDSVGLVEKTAERLSDIQRSLITWTITGILSGASPAIRHFEIHRSDNNRLIQGKLGSAIQNAERVAEDYIGKMVTAEIHSFELRNGTAVHTLARIGVPGEFSEERSENP